MKNNIFNFKNVKKLIYLSIANFFPNEEKSTRFLAAGEICKSLTALVQKGIPISSLSYGDIKLIWRRYIYKQKHYWFPILNAHSGWVHDKNQKPYLRKYMCPTKTRLPSCNQNNLVRGIYIDQSCTIHHKLFLNYQTVTSGLYEWITFRRELSQFN